VVDKKEKKVKIIGLIVYISRNFETYNINDSLVSIFRKPEILVLQNGQTYTEVIFPVSVIFASSSLFFPIIFQARARQFKRAD
jgi:hypothetical protein